MTRRLGGARRLWAALAVAGLVAAAASAAAAQTAAPDRPTGLEATSFTHDSVSLAWDDPANSSVSGYQILRRDRDRDAPGVFAAVVADTGTAAVSYVDTTAKPLKRYVYRVVALNDGGSSPRSSYVNVDTAADPNSPEPAQPTGLKAPTFAHNSVSLTWDDPGDGSITHYQILRRDRDTDDPGKFATIVDDTGSAAVSFTDTTAEPLKRYVYRVIAVNEEGSSPRSGYVNIDTPAQPDNIGTGTENGGDAPEGEGTETITFVDSPPEDEPLIAQQQNSGPQPPGEIIWSTTMTVGTQVTIDSFNDQITLFGYISSEVSTDGFGSLDNDTFVHDGHTYTVRELEFYEEEEVGVGIIAENLIFIPEEDGDPPLPRTDVKLFIGDSRHELDDPLRGDLSDNRYDITGTRMFVGHLWPNVSPPPELSEGDTVQVHLVRVQQGEDGRLVSGRLTVGDQWTDQTFPTACRKHYGNFSSVSLALPINPYLVSPEPIWWYRPVRRTDGTYGGCTRDVLSQWFLVRLEDNRNYTIEINTGRDQKRPRLCHIAPAWDTTRRLRYRDYVDNWARDRTGGTGGTFKLYIDTYHGGTLRGGDYYVRVCPGHIGIVHPDYQIRVY